MIHALTAGGTSWRAVTRAALPVFGLVLLSACGGVEIKPQPSLPKALVPVMPAKVAVVMPSEMRTFTHKETRWGVAWQVELGAGHRRLNNDLFKGAFTEVVEVEDLDKARALPDAKAIFEPRIEQYSFATARETGGRYYAVTIRYRINLYTPTGELADTYTLTGYGNALAKGMSSGKPLSKASVAAMRDAAAKFLVQFPDQPAGKLLASNKPIVAEQVAAGTSGENGVIEAVPINEGPVVAAPPPVAPTTTPSVPSAETPPTPKEGGAAGAPVTSSLPPR